MIDVTAVRPVHFYDSLNWCVYDYSSIFPSDVLFDAFSISKLKNFFLALFRNYFFDFVVHSNLELVTVSCLSNFYLKDFYFFKEICILVDTFDSKSFKQKKF